MIFSWLKSKKEPDLGNEIRAFRVRKAEIEKVKIELGEPAEMALATGIASQWKMFLAKFGDVRNFKKQPRDIQWRSYYEVKSFEDELFRGSHQFDALGGIATQLIRYYILSIVSGNVEFEEEVAGVVLPLSNKGRGGNETKDDTIDRARSLVQVCHAYAVSGFQTLSENYPQLDGVDIEHWDFIVTVACVFIAASRLEKTQLTEKQKEPLREIIANNLDGWKPDAVGAYFDCKSLFEKEFDRLTAKGHEPRFIGSDAIGLWIVWNVLGHAPRSVEEKQLLRAVGGMVIVGLFDYWKVTPAVHR
jgi:hypothetical protein